ISAGVGRYLQILPYSAGVGRYLQILPYSNEREIQTITKGDCSIAEYFARIQVIVDVLLSIGDAIIQYCTEPCDIFEVESMLLVHESKLEKIKKVSHQPAQDQNHESQQYSNASSEVAVVKVVVLVDSHLFNAKYAIKMVMMQVSNISIMQISTLLPGLGLIHGHHPLLQVCLRPCSNLHLTLTQHLRNNSKLTLPTQNLLKIKFAGAISGTLLHVQLILLHVQLIMSQIT
ncbi:hypothetical protein CR513_31883, partial [Mucuna pruriens]